MYIVHKKRAVIRNPIAVGNSQPHTGRSTMQKVHHIIRDSSHPPKAQRNTQRETNEKHNRPLIGTVDTHRCRDVLVAVSTIASIAGTQKKGLDRDG